MDIHRTGPTTARLTHRAFTVADEDAFFALNSHPDVMRLTGEPPLQSVDEARAAIENYPDFRTVGYGRWACVHLASQEIIGFCGLKYLSELNQVDVGYRFLPQYWGRGLATEACRASVAFGLDVLNLPQIIGLVLPQNLASIRVLEKAGLRHVDEIQYEGLTALRYQICRAS